MGHNKKKSSKVPEIIALVLTRGVFILLVLVFLFHFLFRVFSYWENYTIPFDGEYWTKRYYESQWVVAESKNPIGDDGLYTYEAWAYLHGANPVLFNAEVPFLGKYLLAGVIVVFNNQNIFGLATGIFALLSLYLLNLHLFRDKQLAFVPVAFFSFERLFYEQLRAPYFDLLQLSFLLLTLLFALKRKYVLSVLMLGCFASTKFSFMVVIPIAAIGLYYLVIRLSRIELIRFAIRLPLAFLVYVGTYFQYFLLGHSFWQFLGVQKYIFHFYFSGAKSSLIGGIFATIVYGEWLTHWGATVRVNEWWILWPIILFVALYAVRYRQDKEFKSFLLIIIWACLYLTFLMVVPIYPRYLLLLLPFLYNLAIWVISKSIPVRLLRQ